MTETQPHHTTEPAPAEPTWFQVLLSSLAAAFGVQNSRNRRRDFSSASPWKFIVMGLVVTAVMVATLVLTVKLILPS